MHYVFTAPGQDDTERNLLGLPGHSDPQAGPVKTGPSHTPSAQPKRRRCMPLRTRILRRTDRTGECWVWLGATDQFGYGCITIPHGRGPGVSASRRVHRVFYELRFGPVPKGLELDHLCQNKGCIRLKHLRAVTHVENLRTRQLPRKAALAAMWGLRCIRYGVSKGEPYQAYWRARLAARNAFKAVPALRSFEEAVA